MTRRNYSTLDRDREAAFAARKRWTDAIAAGMSHGDVNDRWNVYVRLADFLPGGVAAVEREVKAATR